MPEVARTFRDAIWALSIPVFIIVGIRYGIFTPTEAGAITVLYTILIGVFAYREPQDRRPAEGDDGDRARHQLGDADDLRGLARSASTWRGSASRRRWRPGWSSLTQDPVCCCC